MGNCFYCRDRVKDSLKKVWLGEMLSSSDLCAFRKICRTEQQLLTMTPISLRILPSHCLLIVLSGEVVAYMSSSDQQQALPITSYQAGETMLLLPGLTSSSTGAVECGDYQIHFQLCCSDYESGKALLVDREGLRNFLSTRSYLKEMDDLFGSSAASSFEKDLLQLPAFRSLSLEQVQVMICAMKLTYFQKGQLIKMHDDSSKVLPQLLSGLHSQENLLLPVMTDRSVGLLLKGNCVFVPDTVDLVHCITSAAYGRKSVHRHRNSIAMSSIPSSPASFSLRSQQGQQQQQQQQQSFWEDRCGAGTVFGFEKCFIEKNNLMTDSIVAVENGWITYVSRDALQAIFRLDGSLKRILRRNYHMQLLGQIRHSLPLLSDIEDGMLTALCSKIYVRGFAAGEIIFKKGQTSTNSYVLIHGVVQETNHPSDTPTGSHHSSKSSRNSLKSNREPSLVRYLSAGSLFGEISLVADMPYFSTALAMEPTIVACISKRSLDQVYEKNKTKLAEICIRLAGQEVDLEHVLAHPTANGLLRDFLRKERSEENILFYNAVLQYEELLERLRLYLTNSLPISDWKKLLNFLTDQNQKTQHSTSTTLNSIASSQLSNQLNSGKDSTMTDPSTGLNSLSPRVFTRESSNLSISMNSQLSSHHSLGLSRESTVRSTRQTDQLAADLRSLLAPMSQQSGATTNTSGNTTISQQELISLTQTKDKLNKMVKEVKDAAMEILSLYIATESRCELNLPERIRKATERLVGKLQQQSLKATVEVIFEIILARNQPSALTAIYNRSIEYSVFRQAKQEIVLLLRGDGYQRWKQTPDFQTFLTSVKPYSLSSSGLGETHTNEDGQKEKWWDRLVAESADSDTPAPLPIFEKQPSRLNGSSAKKGLVLSALSTFPLRGHNYIVPAD